jgi:hypothetical protein
MVVSKVRWLYLTVLAVEGHVVTALLVLVTHL